MKPFSQQKLTHKHRVFNYRLSRARRVVENVCSSMAPRFRIFSKPNSLHLENIHLIVVACCVLDNIFQRSHGDVYASPEQHVNNISDSVGSIHIHHSLERSHNRQSCELAKEDREVFVSNVNGEGAVSCQEGYKLELTQCEKQAIYIIPNVLVIPVCYYTAGIMHCACSHTTVWN